MIVLPPCLFPRLRGPRFPQRLALGRRQIDRRHRRRIFLVHPRFLEKAPRSLMRVQQRLHTRLQRLVLPAGLRQKGFTLLRRFPKRLEKDAFFVAWGR